MSEIPEALHGHWTLTIYGGRYSVHECVMSKKRGSNGMEERC